ncbi:hypothetical protein RRF57_013135 [Xylaria bambusicola]|uniref:Uncharacterized protein n=1 Tax=Xylaria bambusicola TaxID=326684 RepID=A0AAN7UXP9_9PEZI
MLGGGSGPLRFVYVAKFHDKLDDLMSRLSARGLPEHDQILSQLLEASTLSNPRPYGDYPRQQTVLNSFAHILLHDEASHFTRLKPHVRVALEQPRHT